MKKLIKLTALLLLTALFTACANSSDASGTNEASDSKPEKYVPTVLISSDEIENKLTEEIQAKELKDVIPDGKWKYQQLTYSPFKIVKYSDGGQSFKDTLTDEEYQHLMEWYQYGTGMFTIKWPLEEYTSKVYTFNQTEGTYTVSEAVETVTRLASDPLVQKVFNATKWEGNKSVITKTLSTESCPFPAVFQYTSLTCKTNSSKTKCYIDNNSTKYYLVKQ